MNIARVMRLACLPALLSLVLPTGVGAQGAVSPDLGLQEVVVTARKRAESAQDVPISVTAVTAQEITERGIVDIRDLMNYTPGFSFTSAFGRNGFERPAVRGQSTVLGDPVASFFVDGVYLSGSVTQTELSNVERVEIIKGPQSALYGRSTYAGAVNYVTRTPTEEFDGRLNASYGEHEYLDADLSLSGPLIADRLYYLISARHYEYAGEYDNTVTGNRFGDEESNGGSIKFRWTPNDAVEGNLLLTYQEDDDGAAAVLFQGNTFNNCQFFSAATPRARGYRCGDVVGLEQLESAARSDVYPPGVSGVDRERVRAALTFKVDFGDGYEFTSASGYSDEDFRNGIDVSYAAYDPLAAFYFSFVPGMGFVQRPASDAVTSIQRQYASPGSFWRINSEDREDFSQELRVASPQDRAFRWTTGIYYFTGSNDFTGDDKIYPVGNQIVPNGASALTLRNLDNTAFFGGIEWDFAPRWTVTAEVRRAKDEIEQESFAYPTVVTDPNYGIARVPGPPLSASFTSTTPRFTLRWQPSDAATLYANIAEGNKPGGFQGAATATLLTQLGRESEIAYGEESVDSYELGGKFRLLDRRLALDVALFLNELSGQQLTTNLVNPVSGVSNSLIENIGESETRGLEIELTYQLLANWTASLGYSYVDAEITEFLSTDQADLYSPRSPRVFQAYNVVTNPVGCVTSTTVAPPAGRLSCQGIRDLDNAEYGDVAGNRPPRAPEHQGFISSRYDGALANGWGWFVGGDVTYEGSKYAQIHNLLETGDRAYVNLRTGIETESWTLMLWGKNLNDDDTPLDILRYIDTRGQTTTDLIASAVPIFRGFAITPPRQRQFGVTLNYRF